MPVRLLSFKNVAEVNVVRNVVRHLTSHGVAPTSIGIITFYAGQVSAIKEVVPAELSVHTVDGFQVRHRTELSLRYAADMCATTIQTGLFPCIW
jgi:hypothetical protein